MAVGGGHGALASDDELRAKVNERLALKLLSTRDHDLVDAKTIVEYRRTSSDHRYLIEWADRLGVDTALRDILAAAT